VKSRAFGRKLYIEHYRDFRREREFVNHQKIKSQKLEEELFFFEVDGMDQSKTLLPHNVNAPKNVDKDLLLNFHITTVK
jgi:hypothetical protein